MHGGEEVGKNRDKRHQAKDTQAKPHQPGLPGDTAAHLSHAGSPSPVCGAEIRS